MRRSSISRVLAVLGLGLAQSVLPAAEPAPSPSPAPTPTVQVLPARPHQATDWKGVEVMPWEITRLPGDLLLCQFHFMNRMDSDFSGLLADNIRAVKRTDPSTGSTYEEFMYDPYDLSKGATVKDEGTGVVFQVDKDSTGALPGTSVAYSFNLRPGDGCFMSVIFRCPPRPQVEPGKKPPKQTISIKLSKVKQAISDLPVPREDGDSVKFHK